jgi:Caspase domain
MGLAAETGSSYPTDRRLGVVILGASTYPHFPARKLDNESFARSAVAFRRLMADENATVFGRPAILDLFDVDDDFASILRRIQAFLNSELTLTDVVFYYCGHGDFLRNRTYYLTLKATEPENKAITVLPLWQLRFALEEQLARKRLFLVLDCCFSGQAAKEWMAVGIGHVIEEQVFQSFPKRGTALIAASARSGPAIAPEGEPLTMFTGALINTVSTGVAGEKRELSFRDIVDAVRARIFDIYGSSGVAPEIHAPQQDEGDITFTPFFANRAFVLPSETKQEREYFELAVGNLDHPFSVTRRRSGSS